MANSISYGPVLQGTSTAGQAGAVFPQLPARAAGDFIQVIILGGASGFPQTTDPNSYSKVLDVVSLGRIYQKGVVNAGAAGGTIEVRFETGGQPYAVVCAIVHADATNPNQPSLPTLTATVVEGDGKVTVNWVPSDPAAFASYLARIIAPSGAVASSGTLPASARSALFTALTNGVEHTFQVDGTIT